MNEKKPFLIVGHRGCAGLEPENTLRAITRAIELGVNMVEVDVHYADGQLIVIHDDTVNRTTDGVGSIHSMSAESLSYLNAGKGERVPILLAVLYAVKDRVALNIELKGEGTAEPVCSLLREAGMELEQILVSSFDWDQLKQARQLMPNLPIGVLVADKAKLTEAFVLAEDLEAVSIHPSLSLLDAELVHNAHLLDKRVIPFTVRTPEHHHHVTAAGADGAFYDDPRMALSD